MKKIIVNNHQLNNLAFVSLFNNYPQLIGYGSVHLYLSFFFSKSKSFEEVLKINNITIFEGEMFLEKLEAYKLVSAIKKGDDLSLVVSLPIVGNFTKEQLGNKISSIKHTPNENNVSKVIGDVIDNPPEFNKYNHSSIDFFKKISGENITPSILRTIGEVSINHPSIKLPILNIALEKTIVVCGKFNPNYFSKICQSFVKLNIISIEKAKLYLDDKNFFKKIDQKSNLDLLDTEINKF